MNVSRSIAVAVAVVCLAVTSPLYGGTAVVTTTADSATGSLRQAILDANSGVCTSPCKIVFGAIFAGSPQTINISSALPSIAVPNVTIDGFSGADGISGNSDDTGAANTGAFGAADNSVHKVTVSGGGFQMHHCVDVQAASFTMKGLVLNACNSAVVLRSTGATIAGNFIGTNTSGTAAGIINYRGVDIETGATGNTIGGTTPADRNVISGNVGDNTSFVAGIHIAAGTNTVLGNYIGVSASGSSAIANYIGVTVAGGTNNSIGTSAMGNVISGNSTYGLNITGGSGHTVKRNRIGTNPLGTVAIANSDGIYIQSASTTSNTIGGSSSLDGNVVSGNSSAGIRVEASSSNNISNNTIGLSNGGTSALANTLYGIRLAVNANTNFLSGNKIAGGATGIDISASSGTTIQTTTIGATFAPISGNGISINSSNDTTITGSTIRYSSNGVVVAGGLRNVFFDSLIFSNTTLGIDLQGSAGSFSGATANDAGDPDTNAGNNLQNFPVITSAYAQGTSAGSPVKILFDLDSSSITSTNSVRVSLYRADTSANPQGETLLTTNCYAGRTFTNKLVTDNSGSLSIGDKVIATATSYTDGACTNANDGTSEFSSATAAAIVALQPGLVTHTGDSGTGSLRQAINDANSGTCPAPCTINFNIPLSDANFTGTVFPIKPLTALPDLMKSQITLDGTSQTAFTGNTNANGPEIVINGSSAGPGVRGLGIGAVSAGHGSDITIIGVVVNGWQAQGIVLQGSVPLTNISLYGNYIGTNETGSAAVANTLDGIYATNNISNLVIGASNLGNLISGNGGNGIYLNNPGFSGVTIAGNTIGADRTQNSGIPNAGNGVFIAQVANGDVVVGTASAPNVIAFNAQAGVSLVGTTTETSIRYNSMVANTGLGIDISNNGVTPNDAGDADGGPNNSQNFPVLTTATFNGTSTTVSGTLNSTPSTAFEIDFYENLGVDPSGYGEGFTHLGTVSVTTDGAGNAPISFTVAGNRRTSKLTATATRVAAGVAETSEFSQELLNAAPTAVNDTVTTNEDTLVNFDPRVNDTDPEGGALAITGHGQPSPGAGSVSCSSTTCDFTPAANYSGSASFTYTITDDLGAASSATVSITVNAVNDPPVTAPDTLNTTEDTPNSVSVLANDTDVDTPAASLQVTGATNGAKGTVSCTTAGVCTYTPSSNMTGADSFTYTMTDGTTSVNGTVNVSISAVNDPPSAGTDSVTINEDSPVTLNVLANDADAENEPLTVTGNTAGTKGTASCTSSGACTYSPNSNANGLDSFTYTVSDGNSTATGTVNVIINAVNDPPMAFNDSISTAEDTPGSVNVLTNDTDPESNPLTVTGHSGAAQGTVSCSPGGTCTYTPNSNANGSDTFSYTVSDGSLTATGTVTVTIGATNDSPVAVNDTLTVAEDTPGTVNVLTNDADPENTALSVTGHSAATKGSVSCASTGACTYTPNANANGTDSFTYTVSDGALTATGTVNVTINPVNDAPVAVNDTLNIAEDTPGTVNVLANDSDPESNPLTVTGNSAAAKGTVSCTSSGACTYTPNTNANGTDTFTYTVTDGSLTANATVTVAIGATNDAPVAVNDSLTTNEDTPGTVNVLTNDADPENSALTVTGNSAATKGSVSCAANGACTYTPNANATGSDSFTYTVSDGALTSSATVAVTINAVNDAPAAVNDTLVTSEDSAAVVNVLTNDTDPENDALSVTGHSGATKGSVSCAATGACTYTPNANATGSDSFTYTVSDGALTSTATVAVTISAVNDPPVALNDAYTASENSTLTVPAPGVLTNDADIDGGPLSATGLTSPANGTLLLNSNGSFTYTPNPGFNGSDSFTYKAGDGSAFSSPATVTINVSNVNDAPVANPDVLVTAEDTAGTVNVSTNDSDPDGDTRSVTSNTNGTKGSAVCTAAGICTYTPNANANGADSFTYTITDGTLTATATVNVTINAVNDAPVAANDAAATTQNTPATKNVTANDSDVDGDALSVSAFTQGANGSVSCTAAGTSPGQCTYTPAASFTGSDSFSYTVTDGQGGSSTAVVNVTVASTNRAPDARNDSARTTQGTAVNIGVLSNDVDPDGDVLVIASYTQPAHGTVTCGTGVTNKAAQCTYTPAAAFNGSDSFTYVVRDPAGATDSAQVTITVASSCASVVTLVSPAADASSVPTAGVLQWNADGGARFLVYLGRAGSGCATLAGETTSRFFNYSGLAASADYEWRVEAVTNSCTVVSSTCGRFRTSDAPRVCPQAPPALTGPANGLVTSSPITFSWTAVEGARSYSVFASVNGAASRLLGTTGGTSLTADLSDGTVSWFVTTDTENCPALQSQSGSFTVCNRAVPVPSIVAQASSDQTYTFAWTGDPSATYEVQEAQNAAFTGARTDVVTGNSLQYRHSVTTSTAFFYRVRQRSSCAQTFGDYSATLRVVIVPVAQKRQTNPSATVPAGSKQIVVQEVFVPGEPGAGLVTFSASVDKPWLTVQPLTGVLPPDGVMLQVLADPATLPNGTFTGTVIVSLTTPSAARVQAHGTVVKSVPVSISLVTPVTPGNNATPPPNALIIPSVGHLDGINSHWQSDIRVSNTSSVPLAYQLTFKPAGGGEIKQTRVDIDAGATTALDDIVRNWYGIGSLGDSANGTLEIREEGSGGSANPVAGNSRVTVASSRTYSVTENGTLGQYIPAVPFANFIGRSAAGAAGRVLTMQQIAQTAAYRTNVGVVEGSGNPASVLISVFNAAGAKLSDIPVSLAAGEQRQMNGLLAQQGITELRDGRIEVRVTSGEGRVTAYASVVDSVTNDPLLVSGVTVGENGASRYVLPGVADLNTGLASWRTDMRVFNGSSIPQPATLTFYPQNDGAPREIGVTLNPGEVKTLDNILQSQFGLTNESGTVHVSTPGDSTLVVSGRTYNQTSNGTFGQFVPAVTASDAVGAGERALQVQQVEDSPRYRTNLGIAEVTGRDAKVEITVTLPDSRISPRLEMILPANSFRQIPILRELGLGNVYNVRIAVRVLEGQGKVAAYGSVIDMITQDPTYVPAQ